MQGDDRRTFELNFIVGEMEVYADVKITQNYTETASLSFFSGGRIENERVGYSSKNIDFMTIAVYKEGEEIEMTSFQSQLIEEAVKLEIMICN